MSEYDIESERCIDCDGHFRHFEGCPWYVGEPVLSLADRLAVQRMLAPLMNETPPF